jgi:hypothetical protein
MNARVGFLKLATFVAVAALAPATVQAQSNRGQLVQAVVKLNQAQLAFAKKLADDAQFAAQFDKAASSQNYDAMASLAASVTGLSKSNIHVGPGALGGDDNHAAASATTTQSIYRLTTLSGHNKPLFSGKLCFDVGVAWGCISW